jgi:hypothetical protein
VRHVGHLPRMHKTSLNGLYDFTVYVSAHMSVLKQCYKSYALQNT